MIYLFFLDAGAGNLVQKDQAKRAFLCVKGRLIDMEGGIGSYHTNYHGYKVAIDSENNIIIGHY
jgi:hypothetical protein